MRIRTSGPYVPNVVLYQAELLSEPVREEGPLASGGALITMPPRPRNRTRNPWPDGHFAGLRRGPAGFIRVGAGGNPRHLLGRRQLVRHWVLIPALGGSIPPAPANSNLPWEALAPALELTFSG